MHLHSSAHKKKARAPASTGLEGQSKALGLALKYLKTQWGWSGQKIAHAVHLPVSTINHWINNEHVPITAVPLHADIEALVHLIAIHRSLEAMFSNLDAQKEWLSLPHPYLGFAPFDKMCESTSGLIFIRQYLDYVRGRGA